MVVLDSPQSQRVAKRVEDWKLRLIDLTRRNRAIYFQPTKTSTLTLLAPDMETLFSRLVVRNRSWEIWQPPQTTLGEIPPKPKPRKGTEVLPGWSDASQLDRILRNLSRRSQSEYTERGVRVLYTTFGQLKWIEKETKQEVLSPLLLTPVELFRESTRGHYQIRVPPVEDEVLFNPSLKLKLKYDFGIDLPSLPEDEEVTPSSYLAAVNEEVEELGWTTEPSVYLSLFSFAKLAIYQDLTDNLSHIVEHPILRALAGVPVEGLIQKGLPRIEDLDSIVDPKKTYQILDADSSQQLCIQYALRGQSHVIHGPPGTGKSQTIANIISEYIASGKSVLFVSEKMAALEVVYNRLKEKNLDEYCLELHSYKANKREVVNELSRVLTEHLKAGRGMSDEDIERLKKRRNQLNTYVESIHKTREPSKLSAYQLLNEATRLKSIPDVPSWYTSFETLDQTAMFGLEDQVRRLSNSWIVVEEGTSFPWRGCKATKYSIGVRSEWINLLNTLIDSARLLRLEAFDYSEKLRLKAPEHLDDYDALQKLANMIASTPYPPMRWLEDTDLAKVREEAERLNREWGEYWDTRAELESRYDNRFRALSRGTADRIEEARKFVIELLQPHAKGDGGLLRHFNELQKYVQETRIEIERWAGLMETVSKNLGLASEPQTINRAKRLRRMTELCEGSSRPERSWLDESATEEVKKYIEKAKTDHQKRDELRKKLSNYREEATNLDLPAIIRYLEGPGSSPLRFLRPGYYRVRDEVSKVTKSGEIPPTILQDLRSAKELKELLAMISSEQGEAKSKLGSYYKQGEPDFDGAKEAINVAKEVLHLVGSSKAPKALRDNLCIGTKPSEELLNSSKSLNESLSRWRAESKKLREILPERLPGKKIRITNALLKELKEWVTDLENRLNALREASTQALITATSDSPGTFNQLLSDLRKAEKLQTFEETEAEQAHLYRETYGNLYQGTSTDWLKVIEAVDWARGLLKALPPKPTFEVKSFATDLSLRQPKLEIEEHIRRIYTSLDELNSRFTEPLWGRRTPSLSIDEILLVSEKLGSRIDDLQSWVDFNETSSILAGKGIGKFVAHLVGKRYDKGLLIDIFRKSMYSGLLTRFLEEDATLRSFRAKDHDQIVDDFRSLDQRLIEETPQKVIEAANTNKPQGVFVETPDSEISILFREAAKKRRQMPLRHLFEKIPNLIRKLKPCLLMSPISVSQFLLPKRVHFDLVVFDEASQIFTEDAVGSIYRGDSLIVTGDNKQLPPTLFFQYVADTDAEWDELTDDMGVFDSVLDECMSIGLPVRLLQWHYRSKHDSLIAFSNNEFYDGRLVLFPSAIHRGSGLGIEFIYVPDGVYDRGGVRNNPRESQVVADIVFNQLKEHPTKSLGVVTFSISQMNSVKDEVEVRLAQYPEYERYLQEDRLRGFFVKNLENVQGDERDIMIISVGYGFDKSHTMTMNFGPINKDGGERRLNVAITRAREKVILVSSIRSSDVDLSSTNAVGVRCLHDYLAYAEEESKPKERPGKEAETLSEIENEVVEEVRRLGYVAVPRVGESKLKVDIGVKTQENPDRFIMGIIIDGEYYRSAATARDRDRLRAQVLESMGWNIHRVWSPEWVQRRSTEVERLASVLKQAEGSENQLVEASRKGAKVKKKSVEPEKVIEREGDELPGVEHYRRASLEPHQTFKKIPPSQRELFRDLYRLELRHLLPKLVHVEGPIHLDYAYKRLNKAIGLKPAPPSFHEAYRKVVEEMVEKGHFQRSGEFLWHDEGRAVKVRVPSQGIEALVRPIEYIPSEEIQAAMLHILEHSMGLSRRSLIQETANIFRARQTPKTNQILAIELMRVLNKQTVIEVGEVLFLANQ